MIDRLDIFPIIKDHYCPFRYGEGRRFSWSFLLLFFVAPTAIGILLAWKVGYVDSVQIPLVLSAYSVLAAVMTGLLPIIHAVVGQSRTPETLDVGQRLEIDRALIRIETLRELYSTISYSVIVLTIGVVVTVALVFVLPSTSAPLGDRRVVALVLSGLVYFVGASTMLSFLNIAVGVYAALEDQAKRTTQELRDHTKSSENSPEA